MNATYTKLKDETWGVRVPGNVSVGATVLVVKKDGTKNNEVVAAVIWTGEDKQTKATISLCKIKSKSSSSSSSSSSRGTCDECGERSSSLKACQDSSGISGYCCSQCANQPSYARSFM